MIKGSGLVTTGREVDDRVALALVQGDLSRLSPNERTDYYLATCKSLGLNPMTKPFEYLKLNGREILYATKACTEQLRARDGVSLAIVSRSTDDGIYVVTARATMPDGRYDESTGAVTIERLAGENRANALMKAETKAKRRVTLSICGLGMLDESEVADIPAVKSVPDRPPPLPVPNAAPQRVGTTAADSRERPALTPTHDPETGEIDGDVPFDLYRERAVALRQSTTLADLQLFWQCCGDDKRKGVLTAAQYKQLGELKDLRKHEIQNPPPPAIEDRGDAYEGPEAP